MDTGYHEGKCSYIIEHNIVLMQTIHLASLVPWLPAHGSTGHPGCLPRSLALCPWQHWPSCAGAAQSSGT